MSGWGAVLEAKGPWVHRLAPSELANTAAAAAHADVLVIELSGASMRSLDDLFREYAAQFRFPAYFGYNWPAFFDCMTDLEWRPAPAFLTVISAADQLLSRNPEEMSTFLTQLERIGERWARAFGLLGEGWGQNAGEVPFHTILVEPAQT